VVNQANAAYQQTKNEETMQQQALSQVNGQISQLAEQQQQSVQAAAAFAQAKNQQAQQAATTTTTTTTTQPAAPARTASTSTTSTTTAPTASDPPPSNGSQGAAAVAAAESQLGVPYEYGAEQPGVGFDCSGLIAWAWGQAGVALPHYSGGQMADTTPVPTSDLQPGDLLFYGPGGSSHVAMYIGNGQEIQAPYTGTVVSIMAADFGDGFVGAGRP
jgi:cell wall-associated NlpC family hydrolase